MILMRILPGVLKELVKHVPTVLFEVVEWKLLASELPKLSRRLLHKEGFSELYAEQTKFLAPLNIHLVTELSKQKIAENKQSLARNILALYFAQLLSPHGFFLDLGPTHFEMKDNGLHFAPSGLWTKFDQNFSKGLKDIYDGFYLGNEELFHKGLIESGLTSNKWPLSDRQKLAELFKSHFGASLTSEMTFDLETFKASFFKIADFMLEKKVTISTDFLYLGIGLITLYSSLENLGEKVNVKEVYLNTMSKL